MARRRRERMSEGKKNIIAGLIQEYDIKTAEDIQEALKETEQSFSDFKSFKEACELVANHYSP